MQVPRIIHGEYRFVDARLRGRIDACGALVGARDWDDPLQVDDLIDTAVVPGLHVLNPPGPLLEADLHYHVFLPLTILLELVDTGRAPPEVEQEVFDTSLTTPWGTLGLLAPANRMWLFAPERHRPFLQAASAFWPTLDAEGARYTVGSATGAPLWSIGSNLKYVLANLGVPAPTLASPLPAGGPASLLPVT